MEKNKGKRVRPVERVGKRGNPPPAPKKLNNTDREKYCEGKVKRDPGNGSEKNLKRNADKTIQVFLFEKRKE